MQLMQCCRGQRGLFNCFFGFRSQGAFGDEPCGLEGLRDLLSGCDAMRSMRFMIGIGGKTGPQASLNPLTVLVHKPAYTQTFQNPERRP